MPRRISQSSDDDENMDDEYHRQRRSKRNPCPEKEEEAGAAELNELLGRIRKGAPEPLLERGFACSENPPFSFNSSPSSLGLGASGDEAAGTEDSDDSLSLLR